MKKVLNLFTLLALFSACSTTSRLGEEDVLYTGVKKIEIVSADGGEVSGTAESAVRDALNVKPNNALYSPYLRTPLPTGLWAWNHLYTEKRRGIKAWLYQRLAKQPVLIADVQPDERMELVRDILDNQGYFGSSAGYELLPAKNPKKARLNYRVTVAEPWFYSQVVFPEVCCPVTERIERMKPRSLLAAGEQYNIDTLSAERIRITNRLREDGYYYFRPAYLEYLADTLQERHKVDMRMVLADGIPPAAMGAYRIGGVSVSLTNPLGGEPDSTEYNGIKIYYQRPLKLRPKILAGMLTVRPGELCRVSRIDGTLTNFSKLGVFRYVNMNVTPLDSLRGADSLDLQLVAAFDAPMDAEIEVDFTSKSNSYIGPGLTFGLRHRNFLRGGENFSVKLNAAYEWQTGNTGSQLNHSTINSYEVGLNASLMFPRMVAPKFIPRSSRFEAKTTYQLGGTLMNRPDFFTMFSANAGVTYDFQSDRASHHSLSPFKLTYNNLLRKTDAFSQQVDSLPYLRRSFENQLIPAMSYTYTYDRSFNRRRDRLVWQTTLTEAGHVVGGLQSLFGVDKPRKLFGMFYSQFVKATTELKYYKTIGRKHTLATRLMVGAAHASGELGTLPYNEQFYIGGANSIRAFTIRSLGPGSFRSDPEKNNGYFDQTGDFKLEANVEFRFNLLGGLYGAIFLDAGNIWLLEDAEGRPGGKLQGRQFFDEIALGTGAGLRYDLSFLVVRADLGVGIHAPYDTGKSGYYNIAKFKDGLGFHLAIGYPF
ncbi:BamA/TamA family outer membrane protein [Alistipes sp. OttesenSCG-928-L06]|nr:BamA/TamA family outer membrane protein [Alistipes sp. OttesenSCG-928-L06]